MNIKLMIYSNKIWFIVIKWGKYELSYSIIFLKKGEMNVQFFNSFSLHFECTYIIHEKFIRNVWIILTCRVMSLFLLTSARVRYL